MNTGGSRIFVGGGGTTLLQVWERELIGESGGCAPNGIQGQSLWWGARGAKPPKS